MAKYTIGISSAASWAWGTSLVLGMEIARTKGLWVFVIWAIANSATLALFGAYYPRIKTAKDIPAFKWFMTVIQAMCLIINLNIINTLIANPVATSLIGIAFVSLVWRGGVATSIATDQYQYAIMILGVVSVIAIGMYQGHPVTVEVEGLRSNIAWLGFSSCVLTLSPICDLQHYQRAEIDRRGYIYGSLFFAAYIALVGVGSIYQVTEEIQVAMIITMLMATSSTIDSISASLQELFTKTTGTLVALAICVFWRVFVDIGALELWNHFGVLRIAFAVIVIITIIWRNKK